MNIFYLDKDPIVSAKLLCNRHIVKMAIESVQMLSIPFKLQKIADIKISYTNHPCSIWTRNSQENFNWLVLHGLAICEEYHKRYKKEHGSLKTINWIIENSGKLNFTNKNLTPFARCFGDFKSQIDLTYSDTALAYQEFYRLDKLDFARWPSREAIPSWWLSNADNWVDKNFRNGSYIKR